jgi:NADPH:quinone reductase-like Zn-dependent oxidoreductase
MKTMRALRFEKYGPPSALTLQDVNVPDLKPGQVLVEVRASAINPSDVKNVAGGFSRRSTLTPLSNAAIPRPNTSFFLSRAETGPDQQDRS